MRKLLVLVCGLAALVGINAVAAAADLKFGVVDLQKIITSDVPVITKARTDLQQKFDPQQKEILALQKDMQASMDKYSKDSAVMKDQEKKDLQNKIMDQQKKIRDMGNTFQADLMKAQDASMKSITEIVQNIITEIARDQKYDFIFAKGAVIYNSNNDNDITAKVIDKLKTK